MKQPFLLCTLFAVALLCGCASASEDTAQAPTFGCPRAGLMKDGDQLAVFSDMTNPSRETVTVKAQLYGITYECEPIPRKGEIKVTMTARFVADRMPLAGDMKGLTLPYFIAVLDDQEQVIAHERHAVRLVFGEGAKNLPPTRARADAEHEVTVTAPTALAANGYKLIAGFELIPAQIRYNQGETVLTPQAAPEPVQSPSKKR